MLSINKNAIKTFSESSTDYVRQSISKAQETDEIWMEIWHVFFFHSTPYRNPSAAHWSR